MTIVCCSVLIFLSGCATCARNNLGFPARVFSINNTVYYPLSTICEHLKISCDYDPIGREVTLRKADATEIKLLLDSSIVLVNGYPVDLQDDVLMHNGIVVVPEKFKERVLDKFYCFIPAGAPSAYPGVFQVKRIVIDAGHGGKDPGAVARSGLREKDVNLDIAMRLGRLLEAQGIEVVRTRSSDKFISLEERSKIANSSNADLFVSIHTNSARSSRLNGFEVFYVTENVDDNERAVSAARNYSLKLDERYFSGESLNLKATLWDMIYTRNRADSVSLAQSICQSVNRSLGLKILGVKGAPFYVLKDTRIPAVLVEVGFISNSNEGKYLRNPFYRQQIAETIAEGILNYSKQCDMSGLLAH